MTRKLTPANLALWAALPMAHTSRLEGRLTMILNAKTRRAALPRRAGAAVALAAALLLPLAAARPVPANGAPVRSVAAPHAGRAAPVPALTLTRAKDRAAERRLKQAEAADPLNWQWPDQLGFLYFLNVADDGTPASRAWARASLTQYDRTTTLVGQAMVRTRHTPPPSGEPVSEKIAQMAYAAGDYDRAKRCALALLHVSQGQELGAVNPDRDATANLILGRLALRGGDTAQAERRLLILGRVPGSPARDSFGPNMRLAKDLLAAGRRDAVLAYLDECNSFWKDAHLAEWRSDVAQGRMPHFGANLYY